ncbi:MAG: hypothetical protein VB858_16400, partial [Planctomycetaceae bacterium]
ATVLVTGTVLSVLLYPVARISGWTLLGLVVFLASYNVRKRLTFIPLGWSALWLQFHIYIGLLSSVLFAVHVDFRIPDGLFEVCLTGAYLSVFVSGVTGLILSRIIPPRLASRGEEVIFERIPVFVRQIREKVEALVLQCISKVGTTAVPDFYTDRLRWYIERPRNYWSHLVHSNRPLHRLLTDIRAQQRYLGEAEIGLVKQIEDQVLIKNDLDYHHAMQKTLKAWLFFHIPLTYGLLVLVIYHVALVYAVAGGIQ